MATSPNSLPVRQLLEELSDKLALRLVAGAEGLDRPIERVNIQRPGLALSGYLEMLQTGRIQVLGQNEIAYLESLSPEARIAAVAYLSRTAPPCLVVTRGRVPPLELKAEADRSAIPLITSPRPSAVFIEEIHEYLFNALASTRMVHGVLVDVIGVGVLIVGKSGIGKSECALDLVLRGHRFVGDDVVEVYKRPPETIVGKGADLIRHHMEVRGLGVINIQDLFGITAVRDRKIIDLVVRLEEWRDDEDYDRLGIEMQQHEILGVNVPMVVLPVKQGRPIASIVEVAARNMLLRIQGRRPSGDLHKKLDAMLRKAANDASRPGATDLDLGKVPE